MNSIPAADSTPREVPWGSIFESDRLDERVSALTVLFGSVVGVNERSVEWCPDDLPPSEQERLAWTWLCNPTLDAEIAPLASGLFHDLILAWRDRNMAHWWRQVST